MPFTKGHKLNTGNKYSVKHGMSNTHFNRIFLGIKKRCEKTYSDSYSNYGGRGIKCEWVSFEQFKKDMYTSYLEHIKDYGANNTQIDRIDNDSNYSKENCKWSTIKEQSLNRRTNVFFTHKGLSLTISQWADKLGLTRAGMRYRLNKMPLPKALKYNK